MLLWNKITLGLGALCPTFTKPSTTANSNFTLVGVISYPLGVYFFTQYNIKSISMALLEDIVEYLTYGKGEANTRQGNCCISKNRRFFLLFFIPKKDTNSTKCH